MMDCDSDANRATVQKIHNSPMKREFFLRTQMKQNPLCIYLTDGEVIHVFCFMLWALLCLVSSVIHILYISSIGRCEGMLQQRVERGKRETETERESYDSNSTPSPLCSFIRHAFLGPVERLTGCGAIKCARCLQNTNMLWH